MTFKIFCDESWHKHKCSCGVVWGHDIFDPDRSHVCPVCGLVTHWIYDGPEPVTPAAVIAELAARRRMALA